jgi:hypothetical protein
MIDKELKAKLMKLLEENILIDSESFSIEKYEDFLQKTWDLKEEFGLENNPLVFLPEPAHTAYYEMMADSMDYFTEPSREAIESYLAKMRVAYEKFKAVNE